MSLQLVLSNRFKKDLRLAEKRGLDLNLLRSVVDKLAEGKTLAEKHKDHDLWRRFYWISRMSYQAGLAADLSY